MKRILKLLAVLAIAVASLTACTSKPKVIEDLKVLFVPSKDAATIIAQTEPLKQLLIDSLADKGFEVEKVTISVTSSYEAAGEALAAGTAHVGFIPANTYVLYHEDGVEVILAATRAGLNKDSINAKDWNDGLPTTGDSTKQVTYYRSIALAGTSAKAQALLAKVNAGTALTWEDVNDATWCHSSTTSASGYVYPTIWLMDKFNKKITDLANHYQVTAGYGQTAADLASGACDIGVGFADFRRDYETKWTQSAAEGGFGRTESVWKETGVLFVTEGVMNDTISVSPANEDMSDKLIKALQDSFIEIAKTEAGLGAIKIYSHEGYVVVTDEDYEATRKAAEVLSGK